MYIRRRSTQVFPSLFLSLIVSCIVMCVCVCVFFYVCVCVCMCVRVSVRASIRPKGQGRNRQTLPRSAPWATCTRTSTGWRGFAFKNDTNHCVPMRFAYPTGSTIKSNLPNGFQNTNLVANGCFQILLPMAVPKLHLRPSAVRPQSQLFSLVSFSLP